MQHIRDNSEEIAAKLQAVLNQVGNAAQSSSVSLHTAKTGRSLLQDASAGIAKGIDAVCAAEKTVRGLSNVTAQIAAAAASITEIARQTNLFSLNASIEAAQAGEQGKGFDVVAQEVRKLAALASRTAAEIGKLNSRIQTETANMTLAIGAATRDVQTGDGGRRQSRKRAGSHPVSRRKFPHQFDGIDRNLGPAAYQRR